ncbi:hypothetical protein NFJ02_24g55300 [Pycnococcus provasolii]
MDALGGGTGAPMQPVSSSSVHTHVSLIRELHNACSLLASQAQAPQLILRLRRPLRCPQPRPRMWSVYLHNAVL